jgi:hypothetical protein
MAHKTNFKDPRGTALRKRREAKRDADAHLKAEKAKVRRRDLSCRWPGCDCKRWGLPLECAHIVDQSLGGSDDASNMILICAEKHRGRPSLHSKHLRIEPLTERGANGPCAFYQDFTHGGWGLVAEERTRGISETRGA